MAKRGVTKLVDYKLSHTFEYEVSSIGGPIWLKMGIRVKGAIKAASAPSPLRQTKPWVTEGGSCINEYDTREDAWGLDCTAGSRAPGLFGPKTECHWPTRSTHPAQRSMMVDGDGGLNKLGYFIVGKLLSPPPLIY